MLACETPKVLLQTPDYDLGLAIRLRVVGSVAL